LGQYLTSGEKVSEKLITVILTVYLLTKLKE